MPLHLPAVSIALVAFPYDCTSFCRKYNNRRLRSSCSRVLGKVSKCYQFTKPAAGVSVSWEAEYSSLSFCLQRNVAGLDTDFWWLPSAVTSFKFSALKILVRRGAGCRQMCLRSVLAMKEALACCAILFLLNGSKWDLPRGKRCQWESIRDELVGCKLWIRLVGFFFPTVITFFFPSWFLWKYCFVLLHWSLATECCWSCSTNTCFVLLFGFSWSGICCPWCLTVSVALAV